MNIGKVDVTIFSRNQNIQDKSSTEEELIGVDDAVPKSLWDKYFLRSQGCIVEEKNMYQDNKSAILLETNENISSSKRTKHIKVRLFFIKCVIACGDLSVY